PPCFLRALRKCFLHRLEHYVGGQLRHTVAYPLDFSRVVSEGPGGADQASTDQIPEFDNGASRFHQVAKSGQRSTLLRSFFHLLHSFVETLAVLANQVELQEAGF